jgi:hypothetical protein
MVPARRAPSGQPNRPARRTSRAGPDLRPQPAAASGLPGRCRPANSGTSSRTRMPGYVPCSAPRARINNQYRSADIACRMAVGLSPSVTNASHPELRARRDHVGQSRQDAHHPRHGEHGTRACGRAGPIAVSTESNVPVPITSDEYRRYPYMCWSAPVNRLRCGRELRRAHGAGAAGGRLPQTFYLVREAEDARFELARACPQHAFQVCWSVYGHARDCARAGKVKPDGRRRTAPNADE